MENYLKERIIHLKKNEVDYFNKQYEYAPYHPLRIQCREFSNEFHARRHECELMLEFLSGETRKDFEKKCDDWKTYKDCVIWQKNQSCLGCKFDE